VNYPFSVPKSFFYLNCKQEAASMLIRHVWWADAHTHIMKY